MSGLSTELVPPAKRRRDDLESSHEEIFKHDALYFDHGNIVLLSSQKDNIITAFKVYKDFLLLHSSVFEGMLSMPSPPDVEEYDGVPLVRLHDEAKDLAPFLAAIYDPTAIPSKEDFHHSVDKVESVFKLSKKYQVDKLLKFMRDTMVSIWPQDLPGWDAALRCGQEEAESTDDCGILTYQEHYMSNLRTVLPEPCTAIRLARDYDVPKILPMAYYHVVSISGPSFTEMSSTDGEHWGLNSTWNPQVNLTRLSRHDLVCLFRGIHAIHDFKDGLLYTLSNTTCKRDSSELSSLGGTRRGLVYETNDVLEVMGQEQRSFQRPTTAGLCFGCACSIGDKLKAQRAKFWDSLPQFFGLEKV